MRKMNSSSKRKWVLGGALCFGAIALLTTGFATWIVGTNNAHDEGDTNVTVDTAKNDSASLEVKLKDSTIKLGETKAHESGVVTNSEITGDLEITFETVKLTYGNAYVEGNRKVTGLKFDLPTKKPSDFQDFNVHDNNAVVATDENDQFKDRAGKMNYIFAPANVTTVGTSSNEGELHVITWTNLKVQFRRGDFFGNDKLTTTAENAKSPADYYNEKFKSNVTVEDTDKITKELKGMNKVLNNKTLSLLIEPVLSNI